MKHQLYASDTDRSALIIAIELKGNPPCAQIGSLLRKRNLERDRAEYYFIIRESEWDFGVMHETWFQGFKNLLYI